MPEQTLTNLATRLQQFSTERDCDQFHTSKNLAMALSVEVTELVDIFQWLTTEQSAALTAEQRRQASQEIGNVRIRASVSFCNIRHLPKPNKTAITPGGNTPGPLTCCPHFPSDVNNFLWTSLETKNPQTFAGCGLFGLNWMLLDLQMVEAAGIYTIPGAYVKQ